MKWQIVLKPPPHDDVTWIKIVEHIRNNQTGEIRKLESMGILDDDDTCSTFIWEEGNFSCDCNRELFFAEAIDVEPPDNISCGDGKFSVNLENPVTRDIFYREFD